MLLMMMNEKENKEIKGRKEGKKEGKKNHNSNGNNTNNIKDEEGYEKNKKNIHNHYSTRMINVRARRRKRRAINRRTRRSSGIIG